MKCDKKLMRLYAVTDRAWTSEKVSIYQQIEDSLKGGVTCLQLREKHLSDEEFFKEAIEIKKLCKKYNVPFIINDNVEIAIKCGADGVHVGQSDMEAGNVRKLVGEKMIIGVSAQNTQQAVKAADNGADYIGVGAMFTTTTKLDAKPVSMAELKTICETVSVPVVAIGGITKENIMELKGTGVDGVALVSAIYGSKDIESECKELLALSESMVK